MSQYVYMNKKFVKDEDATIHVRTHAFLYGTSVFEGIRGYWNLDDKQVYIFKMREHFKRMFNSCKIMCMDPGHTLEEMEQITVELLNKNKPETDTYIRPSVYKTAKIIGPKLLNNPDDLIIFTTPLGQYVDISKGLHVTISSWSRLDDNMIPPRAKIGGSYVNTALIITDAMRAGFDEAITLTQDGHVSEGSAMNLFLVMDGKLVTTLKTDNILEGITRETVIELAKNELGIETIQRKIDRTEVYLADELFYCGTGAQISPITKVDHRSIGSGAIGEICKKLQDLYFDIVIGKNEKYMHWCTPVYKTSLV